LKPEVSLASMNLNLKTKKLVALLLDEESYEFWAREVIHGDSDFLPLHTNIKKGLIHGDL
jgi:hypothetical protein